MPSRNSPALPSQTVIQTALPLHCLAQGAAVRLVRPPTLRLPLPLLLPLVSPSAALQRHLARRGGQAGAMELRRLPAVRAAAVGEWAAATHCLLRPGAHDRRAAACVTYWPWRRCLLTCWGRWRRLRSLMAGEGAREAPPAAQAWAADTGPAAGAGGRLCGTNLLVPEAANAAAAAAAVQKMVHLHCGC